MIASRPWRLAALALLLLACRNTSHTTSRVYVSNEDDGTVTVIDAIRDEVLATIPVGKRPRGIRLSPDGKSLYVALSGSPKAGPGVEERTLPMPDHSADGIGVIDVVSQNLVRILPSGTDPEAFDVSPDGKTIWVSNEDKGEASAIDVEGRRVRATVRVGDEPEGVTLRPDGKFVYVTSESSNEVDVIDADQAKVVSRIPTRPRPRAVVFAGDGQRAYVTAEAGGTVHVIDATTNGLVGDVRMTEANARPMGLALSPDGAHLYVTNGRAGSVTVIDPHTFTVERTIDGVAPRPWGIGVTQDGRKIYVAGGASNDVAVLDAATGAVLKRIRVGASPWGIALEATR